MCNRKLAQTTYTTAYIQKYTIYSAELHLSTDVPQSAASVVSGLFAVGVT